MKAQANPIVTAILAAFAIVIGVSMWSMFTQAISNARSSTDLMTIIANEASNLFASTIYVNTTTDTVIAVLQLWEKVYTSRTVYIIAVASDGVKVVGINISSAYVAPHNTPSFSVYSSKWVGIPLKVLDTKNIYVLTSQGYTSLSLWTKEMYVKAVEVHVVAAPLLIKIEIPKSNLNGVLSLVILLDISGKLYELHRVSLT